MTSHEIHLLKVRRGKRAPPVFINNLVESVSPWKLSSKQVHLLPDVLNRFSPLNFKEEAVEFFGPAEAEASAHWLCRPDQIPTYWP